MMNHDEIEKSNLPDKQKEMLTIIADYNEGWIDEDALEERLKKTLNKRENKKS